MSDDIFDILQEVQRRKEETAGRRIAAVIAIWLFALVGWPAACMVWHINGGIAFVVGMFLGAVAVVASTEIAP